MIRARYGTHTFPHRRIRYRVLTARQPYTCTSQRLPATPPPGHVADILPGTKYVRVAIMPREKRDGWTHAKLCPLCAVHFGLATPEDPDELLRAFRRAGLDEIAESLLSELEDDAEAPA